VGVAAALADAPASQTSPAEHLVALAPARGWKRVLGTPMASRGRCLTRQSPRAPAECAASGTDAVLHTTRLPPDSDGCRVKHPSKPLQSAVNRPPGSTRMHRPAGPREPPDPFRPSLESSNHGRQRL
jgi:hypothetical protein